MSRLEHEWTGEFSYVKVAYKGIVSTVWYSLLSSIGYLNNIRNNLTAYCMQMILYLQRHLEEDAATDKCVE